jgi:WD40 repeat protein
VPGRRADGAPFDDPMEEITAMGFGPDGQTLILIRPTAVTLWDASHDEPRHIDRVDTYRDQEIVTNIALSPDGKTLATINVDDGSILVWDFSDGAEILRTGEAGESAAREMGAAAFSPDGTLAATSVGDELTVWNIAKQQPVGDPFRPGTVSSLAFGPDGQTLAVSNVNVIDLWDTRTSQSLGRFTHTGERGTSNLYEEHIFSLAFSPDGQTLASGGQKRTIKLWDVATQQPIGHPLAGHSAPVGRLVSSPDGEILASSGFDGTILLWDVSPESWRDRACRIANRNLTELEWRRFLGDTVEYDRPCPDLPADG